MHDVTINNKIMALEITDENFEELVLKSDKPVMVDFWAPWCGPCRMIGPIIDQMSEEFDKDIAVIGKLNVDGNPETAAKFQVRSIPTIIFFKDGEVANRSTGVMSKQHLESKLNEVINKKKKNEVS